MVSTQDGIYGIVCGLLGLSKIGTSNLFPLPAQAVGYTEQVVVAF
jgi:hypothetical protein